MRASFWWIDRWRKSTAYTDMSLAEQGAYRNLLDELWLRDGVLPNDDRILAKVCGDARAWKSVKNAVLSHFFLSEKGWENETHNKVMAESKYRADKQRRYRNNLSNVTGNVTQSPSPDIKEINKEKIIERVQQKYPHFDEMEFDACEEWCVEYNQKHPKENRTPNFRTCLNWAKKGAGDVVVQPKEYLRLI